ncbi:hypothetical protein L873DRAFT_1820973 [Choiromyces venosus 120613-1]|uniref:Uncharacterized protein n=1 Tax=Choiromyces venosus 120613-1 TaxID=1336337 RepID=A0A3N4J0B8_9PEZI|nr:hypothetical protein L873DRAFT_1820973 [Choiromyces venosus 120613-1]
MADKAHTTGQSEISDKLQPAMMVPATADSRLGQELVSFEQVMQFTAVEVVAWLQKTSVFTQAGTHGPAIEAAIMLNHLSGEVMLLKGHDTEWLTRFLPTYGACVRLSSRVMQLYYNAGVPLPTRIDTPTGAGVHAQDLSSKHGVATRIESPVMSTGGVRNISTPDTVATRIESAEVSALGVRGLSTPETGIPLTAGIESPAVSAAGVLHLSTPDTAATRIESSTVSAAGVRALFPPDTGILLPTGIQAGPSMVATVHQQDHLPIDVDISLYKHHHTWSSGYQDGRSGVFPLYSTINSPLELPLPLFAEDSTYPAGLLRNALQGAGQFSRKSATSPTCPCLHSCLKQSYHSCRGTSCDMLGIPMGLRKRRAARVHPE